MMENQVIPEAAVEAAMMAFDPSWDTVPAEWRDYFLRRTRAALEAAAPHMLAQVWEAGAVAGWKQSGEGFNAEYPDESTGECSVDLSANPYR